ncbi:hypothetical protein ACFFNY_00685 [Paenibacillus hodogayensis]|uniref:Uncharacterized protein n=1 Tax=Paenibacillus hodogayensis TaxID=279208 RepID=A0ABV5VP74_9BACL
MIKFDAELYFEAELKPYAPVVERRGPLIDIYVKLAAGDGAAWPADLTEPGALVVCDPDGQPIHYVVLEEGCDSEYGFTDREKQQLMRYMERERLLERADG